MRSTARRAQGCGEALFCLGDKPEAAFSAYRRTLAELRPREHRRLPALGRRARARARGLLPHTNAGCSTREAMTRLRAVNVSLGLMLENVSPRLCEPGMPHHRAPDKRPEKRLRMIDEAGRLRIPFTTGILVGIGETRRERIESLLAIRALHRALRAHPGSHRAELPRASEACAMADAPEPDDGDGDATRSRWRG